MEEEMIDLKESDPYLIAETAYSFEGSAEYLMKQTMELPKEIKAVKYHMLFNIDGYMVRNHSVYSLLSNWIINRENWKKIIQYAKRQEHDVIILADDTETINFLETIEQMVDGLEVHAACLNDKDLLNKAIKFAKIYGKTLFVGISGFEIQELTSIVEYIRKKGLRDIVLMYGFQNYPTQISEVRLAKIPAFEKMFSLPVGYADHTKYDDSNKEKLILTAYALGAKIQEIHYVVKEGEQRTDAVTAVSAESLMMFWDMMQNEKAMIGEIDYRLNQGEKSYLNFRKVPVYSSDFRKGHVVSLEDIKFIRVEVPKRQHFFSEEEKYVGLILQHDVIKDQEIVADDFI